MGIAQMVRNINVSVSNGQYERLEDVKGDRTWREAILEEFAVIEEVD